MSIKKLKAAIYGAAQSVHDQREASTNPNEDAFRRPRGDKGKKILDKLAKGENPDDDDQEDA
jgi:hypothetical protein